MNEFAPNLDLFLFSKRKGLSHDMGCRFFSLRRLENQSAELDWFSVGLLTKGLSLPLVYKLMPSLMVSYLPGDGQKLKLY